MQLAVEQQKYANCGPEVIENFILYLTGKRLSQEKAIELHSKLVENALLGIEFSNTHLLCEDSSDNYQNYKDLLHDFDYDNHQLDLLGSS